MIDKQQLSDALSKNVKALRKLHNELQSDMAERVGGISPEMIGMIERGERFGTIETVAKLAVSYGVSVDWLIGLSENSPTAVELLSDKGRLTYLWADTTDGEHHYIKWNGRRYIKQTPKIKGDNLSVDDLEFNIDSDDVRGVTSVSEEEYNKNYNERVEETLNELQSQLREKLLKR